MTTQPKRSRVIVSLLFLVGLLSASLVPSLLHARMNTPFDRNVWSSAKQNLGMRRQRNRMVQDVVRNRLRKGMSRTEVIGVLGSPDDAGAGEYTYIMDYPHFFSEDPLMLSVRFDKSDRLVDAHVISG